MNILRKTGVTDCFLNIAAIIVLICTILLSAITLYQNTEVVLSVKGCSVFVYLTLLLVIVSVTLYFLIKVDIPKNIHSINYNYQPYPTFVFCSVCPDTC